MRDRLFLPETISEALDIDLATGLRAIADALDGGQLDGKHLGTIAAAGGSRDDRIHLRVSLDLAAPIVQRDDLEDAERGNLPGERALLHPPHDMNKADYLRCAARPSAMSSQSSRPTAPNQSRETEFECGGFVDPDTELVD